MSVPIQQAINRRSKTLNKLLSRVRTCVERVFGLMATSMAGLMIHTMALAWAKAKMAFKNIDYNMRHFSIPRKGKNRRRVPKIWV